MLRETRSDEALVQAYLSAKKAGMQAELKALREQVKSLQEERDLLKKQLKETLGMMPFLPKKQLAYQFIAPPLPRV